MNTVMEIAQSHARRLGHNFIGTEFILLGLIEQRVGIASSALLAAGVKPRDLRAAVDERVGKGNGVVAWEIPRTPRAKCVIETSWKIAAEYEDNYFDTEHLLLAILEEKESLAAIVLKDLDVNFEDLRADIRKRIVNRHERARQNHPTEFTTAAEKDAYILKCKQQMNSWLNRAWMAKQQSRDELVRQALERKWGHEKELARAMNIDPPDEPEDPDDLMGSDGPDSGPPTAPAGVPRRPKPTSGDTEDAVPLPKSEDEDSDLIR